MSSFAGGHSLVLALVKKKKRDLCCAVLEAGPHVVQAGLELPILHPPPEYWDYRHTVLCPVLSS